MCELLMRSYRATFTQPALRSFASVANRSGTRLLQFSGSEAVRSTTAEPMAQMSAAQPEALKFRTPTQVEGFLASKWLDKGDKNSRARSLKLTPFDQSERWATEPNSDFQWKWICVSKQKGNPKRGTPKGEPQMAACFWFPFGFRLGAPARK